MKDERGHHRQSAARVFATRLLAVLAVSTASATLLATCAGAGSIPSSSKAPSGTLACTNSTELAKWPNSRLAMMTIAVPVEETSTGDVTTEVSDGAGGVLLFGATAPTNLGSDLKSLKARVPGNLGLLVMTDEEGGGVQRMANLVGSLPWASWMGHYWTAAHIESAATAVAKKMAAANVNMDLAPVVDVDGTNAPPSATDPDGWRSFSGHTPIVVQDGLAFMNGLRSGGVIPVLKHFPGLGGVSGNTDDGPAHTLPWSKLEKVALPPFIKGIKDGALAIMVSNATVPGLASYPASLSPAAIGRELETTLGFHGLVLTDSLTAGAISGAGFTLPEAAAQALIAGADMVLFGPTISPSVTESDTSQMQSAIVEAVANGHLPRPRLIAAAAAVLGVRDVKLCH
ncbi:MAG: glycoside hydrolase family 3 N-terminal domain-containing protein [Acidimicrobiales bacterium]